MGKPVAVAKGYVVSVPSKGLDTYVELFESPPHALDNFLEGGGVILSGRGVQFLSQYTQTHSTPTIGVLIVYLNISIVQIFLSDFISIIHS